MAPLKKKTHSIRDEKVVGAWSDMAADQDVPVQADHHQSGLENDDNYDRVHQDFDVDDDDRDAKSNKNSIVTFWANKN